MFNRIRRMFSTLSGGNGNLPVVTPYASITADMVDYISKLSKFGDMTEEEIYEQMLVFEADIGGGIDKMSTLVGESFKGFVIKSGESLSEDEQRCVNLANEMVDTMEIEDIHEGFTEILIAQGNLFVIPDDGSIQIQPNKYVTLLDKKEDIGTLSTNRVITSANWFVLFENDSTKENVVKPMSDVVHIKYKVTPVFQRDLKNRETYGLYSMSPLQRAILPVWWKRQTMIIDIMWRWRNVPREHHQLDGSMFTLDKFSGSKSERIVAATNAAQAAVNSYIANLKNQDPDQGYVTLDNVSIDVVKQKAGYMKTNELMNQLDEKTWMALNIPESIVNGKNPGSYASEIAVSNYVSAKIIKIAKKFKPLILGMVRDRISEIDENLPVNKLDIKYELVMATSKMELFRQAAIMASIGIFTETEIRELGNYMPLTEEMRKELVDPKRETSVEDKVADAMRVGNFPTAPDTPHSDEQRKSDPGERVSRSASED